MSFPTIDAPAWVQDALCAQTDPEAFFPTKGGYTEPAKRICRACPIQAACLAYALADNSLDGIWGGTTPRQRRAIRGVPATGLTAAA